MNAIGELFMDLGGGEMHFKVNEISPLPRSINGPPGELQYNLETDKWCACDLTDSSNLGWWELIDLEYHTLAPTSHFNEYAYLVILHCISLLSTQNIGVNHLAPTQCPHIARLVLQILEPSCTQLQQWCHFLGPQRVQHFLLTWGDIGTVQISCQ